MKTKKLISLLLSLAMILTALPLAGVTAFAENEAVNLRADKYSAKIGDIITVYLDVENLTGIAAKISFDPESFEFVSETRSDVMFSAIDTNSADNGYIKISAAQTYLVTDTIAEFEFVYLGGYGEITADIEDAADANDISVALDPVSITVTESEEAVTLYSDAPEGDDGTYYAKPGDAISLYLNVEDLSALETTINFDAEAFEFVNATASGIMKTEINTNDAAEGALKIAGVQSDAVSGMVAEFEFTYLGGYGEITADIEDAVDANDESIALDPISLIFMEPNEAVYLTTYSDYIVDDTYFEKVGDVFSVYLEIVDVSSIVTTINFDTKAFRFVSATASEIMNTEINTNNAAGGSVKIAAIKNHAVTGTVVEIQLEYIGGVGVISANIEEALDYNDNEVFLDSESITIDGLYTSSDFEYIILDDNTVEITNYFGSAETLEIPATLDGHKVAGIGSCAFMNDSLTSVTIPASVTFIDWDAFSACEKLTDVYILNKECAINNEYDNSTIPSNTTIHGYAGSTAESYAKEHGNKFVAICAHSNMEKVPAKAATCTEDGNVEYYHCPDCNKNFKDKDGKEEVTDVVVKATGHNYENGVCTVCGEKDPNAPKPTGEVSGDNKLSTVDAKWILQNIAKSREFSDEQFKAADLNGDGKLSVVDVKWVLQIVAGMRNAETLELITK